MTETEKRLSDAELVKLQNDADLPNLPTQDTYWYRKAIGGEGPHAYNWSDKPHRLVYDLCRIIESQAAERLSTPSQGNVERARVLLADKCERLGFTVWAEGLRKSEEKFYIANDGARQMCELAIAALTQALSEPAQDISAEASAILRTLGSVPDTTDLSETDAKVSVGFLRRLLVQPAQGTSVGVQEKIDDALVEANAMEAWAERPETPGGSSLLLASGAKMIRSLCSLPLPVSANGSVE